MMKVNKDITSEGKFFRVLWVLQNQIFIRLFLYISLPLGRACYTLLICASAINMLGVAGRYSATEFNAGLAEYLPGLAYGRDIDEESVASSAKG